MKRSGLLIGLGALLGILLFGGAAWAFAQGADAEYVYACVKDDSMRLVVNATDCKDTETPIGIPTEAAIAALEGRIADLEDDVAALQAADADLQGQIDAVQADLSAEAVARAGADADLQGQMDTVQSTADAAMTAATDAQSTADGLADLLQHFSRDGNEVYITGANLHVVNGTGATDGDPNSVGNIIIGYNELRAIGDDRSGSHMLVVGRWNNYSSYGGIVVGDRNTASGAFASVSGGSWNTASGEYASVSGGYLNTASGPRASVSGGYRNTASGEGASVSGGDLNTASTLVASVSGGWQNTASGEGASVSGGILNKAIGWCASVGGGQLLEGSVNVKFLARGEVIPW